MKSKASVVWQGGLKDGKGVVSTDSGAVSSVPYNFVQRFEGAPGTNPEELIAAAHASCFSMALSKVLADSGMTPGKIETKGTVTLEKQGEGFAVTSSHLDVVVTSPGADADAFAKAAEAAKTNCPISKLLNTTISMNASLAG